MPAAARSSYHHGALRQALLDGARELLVDRGEAGFSLNELARRVGVSSAAPYRHFKDRDALLAVLADEGYAAFQAAMQAAVTAADGPADGLLRIGDAYLSFAADNPAQFRLMFRQWPWREAESTTFDLLGGVVAKAQQAGYLPTEPPPPVLARTIWATVHGLATLHLTGGLRKLGLDTSPEQLVRDAFATILRRPLPAG